MLDRGRFGFCRFICVSSLVVVLSLILGLREGTGVLEMLQIKALKAQALTGQSRMMVGVDGEEVLFQDDFDEENDGRGVLNYDEFAYWEVQKGTVDLIGHGFYDYFPEHDLYLDLDGSTNAAGTLVLAKPLLLEPGTYRLEFDLAGNPLAGPDTVFLSVDDVYGEQFTMNAKDPFRPISRSFIVNEAVWASIQFAHTGGDNGGLFLDNVKLVREQQPGLQQTGGEDALTGTQGVSIASDQWINEWEVSGSVEDFVGGGKAGFYQGSPPQGDAHPNPGRSGVLYVHPQSPNEPVRLVRELLLDSLHPRLMVGVSGNYDVPGDWSLVVKVNGEPLGEPRLIAGWEGWQDLAYSLDEYANEWATLEVEVWPNNWYYEYAFIDYLVVEGEKTPVKEESTVPTQQCIFRLTTGELLLGELIAFENGVFILQTQEGIIEKEQAEIAAIIMGSFAPVLEVQK